jgi:hypothetical protein
MQQKTHLLLPRVADFHGINYQRNYVPIQTFILSKDLSKNYILKATWKHDYVLLPLSFFMFFTILINADLAK